MSLTKAFRAQDLAARAKQTEDEYTARARNRMLLHVYPAVATWFKRRYDELVAQSVRGTALGQPVGNGKGEDRIWYEPTSLFFKPENEHWHMQFSASLQTRKHNTYTETEDTRETSLRLSFSYDGYGGTVQVLYLPFECDRMLSADVHAVLDQAWWYLDEHALEKLGDAFWDRFQPMHAFTKGLQVKDTRY